MVYDKLLAKEWDDTCAGLRKKIEDAKAKREKMPKRVSRNGTFRIGMGGVRLH